MGFRPKTSLRSRLEKSWHHVAVGAFVFFTSTFSCFNSTCVSTLQIHANRSFCGVLWGRTASETSRDGHVVIVRRRHRCERSFEPMSRAKKATETAIGKAFSRRSARENNDFRRFCGGFEGKHI